MNYHTAKAYHYALVHLSNREIKERLLVLQMGKVGSTTIVRSLNALGLDMPIHHVHFLTDEYIEKNEKWLKENFSSQERKHIWLLRHICLCQYLRKRIATGLKGEKWKIVTLTREPIGRNISAFFQNCEVERLESAQQFKVESRYGFEITVNDGELQDLANLFFEKFDHDTPLVFFDRELKGILGVDVFSSEFPKSKGYQRFKGEHVDLLLIRLENLDACAAEAFNDFLDIVDFSLIKANISSKKEYYALYRQFLDSIVLPDSYIEKMYSSKFMRHFYSEKEIVGFRVKWSRSRA